MRKNFVNFLLLFILFFTEIFTMNIANALYEEYDSCPDGSYQVPLSRNQKFRNEEHAQLAKEGTGLIRGLSSIRPILSSHWSLEDLIMCFSGIVLNRRQVGHHEIFGQYRTYHRDDPGRVVSFIPVFFNAANIQAFHGIKKVDEEDPHAFEDPHIFSDPQWTRAIYAKMILKAGFSREMSFPDFSFQSLREKIRETIDPKIRNVLTMRKEDYQRGVRERLATDSDPEIREDGEIFTGRIFIMRIGFQDQESTDIRYYMASWLKELSKGEFIPPVGLHAMLIRYSSRDEILSFSELENSGKVRNAFVSIPKSAEYFWLANDVGIFKLLDL